MTRIAENDPRLLSNINKYINRLYIVCFTYATFGAIKRGGP